MADNEDAIGATINEIYGIVSELSISPDKAVQQKRTQLRKLLEQLKNNVAAKLKTAE